MKFSAFCTLGLAFFSLVTQVHAAMKQVDEREYGKMPDGTMVKEFTLRNGKGAVAKVISYGATLTELQMPDKTGAKTNVVLGAGSLDEYLKGFNASAATIGRYGNRIAKARFTLDGVEYKLAANNGVNHLHGGPTGFAKRVWTGQALDSGSAVQFTLIVTMPPDICACGDFSGIVFGEANPSRPVVQCT